MVVPSTKKKQMSLRSNLISFLLGISFAYLFMQPNACPPKEDCNCEHPINETTLHQAAETVSEKSSTTVVSKEKSFYDIGLSYGTDKVKGPTQFGACLKDEARCVRPGCVQKECRPWGHWYHTLYQQRLGKYSLEETEPFQFLEIGFFKGNGYQTYRDFFAATAEVHSMEITCGPKDKFTSNSAEKNKNYQQYLDEERLHCGDASNLEFLDNIWKTKMHRPGAPPLRIVVDDGSHHSWHMAQSVFFWFPRIEPGGLMVVEDIQPIREANRFRTQFLPQLMSDLHYCGDPKQSVDAPCFPLIQRLLHSIHCEMHICILERNQEPAIPDLPLANSTLPENTLNAANCPSIGKPFGSGLPAK